MAKIAVLVEQITDDEFVIYLNADEPGKSVNDHCALIERSIAPGWRLGIEEWLANNGYRIHKDSDYPTARVALED